ncbi:hypothetical protein DFQ28_009628 [Apophysomyces sp. BC1034]|nr:hypothetical protein DFQ30_004288 [Apophysomyces sp. BC1015]KAG0172554.1 hypothetical protein DFQ29_008324 [Apophysomyces sp. BC1021]KAG0185264.1 hypothetical protein DFQ28_009628 [Apophysomyces sp. BC1034]
MAAALRDPSKVSKLLVVDMPPVSLGLSNNFSTYIAAMKEIEDADPQKQSEADKILAKYESNVGIRTFLLTNLKRNDNGKLRFRVPYTILGNALTAVGNFDAGPSAYEKPTLFVAGGKSPYYPPFLKHAEAIRKIFPKSQLEVVQGAGHWVHAEQPEQVLQLVSRFVNES